MRAEEQLNILKRLGLKRSQIATRLANELEKRALAASEVFVALTAYTAGSLHLEPDALTEFAEGDPEIAALCQPEPKRRLHLAVHYKLANRKMVYSAGDGGGLLCWRTKAGLLVESERGKVVSWSRPLSVTGPAKHQVKKHLFGTTDKKASYFNKGIIPAELELAAFSMGVGHFDGAKLFMYARFAHPLGQVVAPSVGQPGETDIIKVQFDRAARPKYIPRNGPERKQGFYLRAHGYPLSFAELHRDFPSGEAAVLKLRLP